MNCFSDLKSFANSRPSASNFKSFTRSLEHFFLTEGQINFGNKIPLMGPIATQNSETSIQFHLRSNVQSVSNVFGIPFLLFHIFLNIEVVQH